jgi:hypothetical protein
LRGEGRGEGLLAVLAAFRTLDHTLALLLWFVCNAKEDERMWGPHRPAEIPGERVSANGSF